MADDVSQLTHPIKQARADIDTTLPFQSVKAAVSLFGEKADVKKFRLPEKHGTKEAELHQLKQELANVKLQLTDAEKAKAKAFAELRDSKKLLEEMAKGLGEPCSSKKTEILDALNTDGMKQSSPNAEEKHVVWEVQLKVAQEQHMTAVAELESAKKELEKLQRELVASLGEKENALRQAEEALNSAEVNARRVEELSHEISGTNESLVLVKLACIEASKERAALLAAKSGVNHHHQSLHLPEQDSAAVQELEIKLAVATEELIRLQRELAAAKKAEEKVARAASEAFTNLEHAKSELEKTQMLASSASTSSNALSSELGMAKRELEKALEDGNSLQATMEALQTELESMRKELADLREREANASAAVVTLTTEFLRMKAELEAAIAAEAKANEAILGLSQTLQQITTEAEEAKSNAKTWEEEAAKARADAEQAKAAMISVECKLQTALKAAEEAKAAEGAALERFRALFEKASIARASGVEAGAGITISQEEYDTLKKKVHEAEELANMRVAAASAQIEAVKMGELELQQKLETLNDDINAMKSNTKQALQRAEMAEAAKFAVESEMRRWREKELHVRGVEREATSVTQKDYLKMRGKSQPLAFSHAQPAESLAQILNMKMPSLEKETRAISDRAIVQKKKKHVLPSFGTFLGKKNQPTVSNLLKT